MEEKLIKVYLRVCCLKVSVNLLENSSFPLLLQSYLYSDTAACPVLAPSFLL